MKNKALEKMRSFWGRHRHFFGVLTLGLCLVLIFILGLISYLNLYLERTNIHFQRLSEESQDKLVEARKEIKTTEEELEAIGEELEALKSEDQRLINQTLEEEISNIQKTYQKAVRTYEKLLSLKNLVQKTDQLDTKLAEALSFLSKRSYASASAVLTGLEGEIEKEREKAIVSIKIPEKVMTSNVLPVSGYRRQTVQTGVGAFMVSIISADLNSNKVIVDTASDSDCADNCPVLPLGEYVARNNAFAGVNGSYFCPATYPSCAGKKNSFDTLLMNKNKRYFNSNNNVYSSIPAAIFNGNTGRFVAHSSEWGRDTSVDAVIANHPLLVLNSQIYFWGDPDVKKSSRGNRSFIGVDKGSTVYIGVVHSASVAESAQVLHALGLNHALNLDDGGSTALWYGGYKVGPGRNLPNVVLLVRK